MKKSKKSGRKVVRESRGVVWVENEAALQETLDIDNAILEVMRNGKVKWSDSARKVNDAHILCMDLGSGSLIE